MLNSKLYDTLKLIALIVLPALATFILGYSMALDWKGGTVVAGIIVLFNAALGSILQVTSERFKSYQKTDEAFDGYVQPQDADPDTGIPGMQFTISRHPIDFLDRAYVRLKVGAPPRSPVFREPLPEADPAPEKHDRPAVDRVENKA